MILSVAVALTSLGFVAWILGTLFNFPELGVIGGTVVVAIGAMFLGGDLEHRAGEIESSNATTNETTVSYQYADVELPSRFPLGLLTMLLGGTMALRSLDAAG